MSGGTDPKEQDVTDENLAEIAALEESIEVLPCLAELEHGPHLVWMPVRGVTGSSWCCPGIPAVTGDRSVTVADLSRAEIEVVVSVLRKEAAHLRDRSEALRAGADKRRHQNKSDRLADIARRLIETKPREGRGVRMSTEDYPCEHYGHFTLDDGKRYHHNVDHDHRIDDDPTSTDRPDETRTA